MDMIKLALIGCGSIGKAHAQCVSRIPEARFEAYVDICEKNAQTCLREFGGNYATPDVKRVFNDRSIHAVYICTLHDSHAPLAIAAARAGKHILLEKPIALNLEDSEAVAIEVNKAGVFLMPAYKMRYYSMVQKACEFIPRPQVLVGQMMAHRWTDTYWAQDPVKGGGNVHSQGCHMADLLRFLSGSEPQAIWAAGGSLTHPGHPCIDQCVATIRFVNGHVASWIQGDAAMGSFTGKIFIELFGNEGRSVQLHDRLKKAVFTEGEKTWTAECAEEEGLMCENQEFIFALKEKREPTITLRDGIQATRIILAADRAIRTGVVQYLN